MRTDVGLPLKGVRVLGFIGGRAGAFCASALSDLGAEVVEAELPGAESGAGQRASSEAVRRAASRGKKSVAIDPATPTGRRVLFDLAAAFDVVVEDLGPGAMDGLGLGRAALAKANPRQVYASISAFGRKGPPASRQADEFLAEALGGFMDRTGWPGTPPTAAGSPIGEYSAAMACAAGVCAALFDRARTGRGRSIDVAIADCLTASALESVAGVEPEGRAAAPIGSRDRRLTPFQAFRAADGWIAVAVTDETAWKSLCGAIDRLDLFMDARFSDNDSRTRAYAELAPELDRTFGTRDAAEWRRILDRAEVPCAPVLAPSRLGDEPLLRARNAIVSARAGGESVPAPGNAIKMDGIPERLSLEAPDPGRHTESTLREILGLGDAAIAALKADGAIG